MPSPSIEGFAPNLGRQPPTVSSFKTADSLFTKGPVFLGQPQPTDWYRKVRTRPLWLNEKPPRRATGSPGLRVGLAEAGLQRNLTAPLANPASASSPPQVLGPKAPCITQPASVPLRENTCHMLRGKQNKRPAKLHLLIQEAKYHLALRPTLSQYHPANEVAASQPDTTYHQ